MILTEKDIKIKLAQYLQENPYFIRRIYDVLEADTNPGEVFSWMIQPNTQIGLSPIECIRQGQGEIALEAAWAMMEETT